MEMQEIIDELQNIPKELNLYENKILAKQRKIFSQKEKLNEIQQEIYRNICNETEGGGLKFPNEMSIKLEVDRRLKADSEIKNIKARIYTDVSKEVGDDEKPLFKGVKVIDTEVLNRIQKDSEYVGIKGDVTKSVREEMGELKPRYPTKDAKDFELNNRLKDHAEYPVINIEVEDSQADIEELRIKVSDLQVRMKCYRMIIDLLKIKLED